MPSAAMQQRPQGRSDAYPPRAATPPTHGRSGSTVLINLTIRLHRATIGHDISADDEDLLVLFRRNSKEVTSDPTPWRPNHTAEWTQTLTMQTSLLRPKVSNRDGNGEFLRKDYEIVLVALPSHSAVALFSLDFADVAQSQAPTMPQLFTLTPRKCRDLSASLQVELAWDYATAAPATSISTGIGPRSMTATRTKHTGSVVSSRSSHSSDVQMLDGGPGSNVGLGLGSTNPTIPSFVCPDCRTWRRKLERKDVHIQQLDAFVKESQKRIDSLVVESDELAVREQAETQNATQYRVLNLRLLQELEMAFQFCLQQMMAVEEQNKKNASIHSDNLNFSESSGSPNPPAFFMFLPEFEFMNRVKAFHAQVTSRLDQETTATAPDGAPVPVPGPVPVPVPATAEQSLKNFDFEKEMHRAIERNRTLEKQLEFVCHSMAYDVPMEQDEEWRRVNEEEKETSSGRRHANSSSTTTARKLTGTSEVSDFSVGDGSSSSRSPSVARVKTKTMTEQLNALERENFLLKAKLESARLDASKMMERSISLSTSESAETISSSDSTAGNNGITGQHLEPTLTAIHEEQEHARAELSRLQEEKEAVQRELEAVKSDLENARRSPVPVTTSSEIAEDHDESETAAEDEEVQVQSKVSTNPAMGGNDFLSKIYADVGRAKIALEEQVKALQQQLLTANEENSRLVQQMETSRSNGNGFVLLDDSSLQLSVSSQQDRQDDLGTEMSEGFGTQTQVSQLQTVLEDKASQLKVHEQEVSFLKEHLTEKTKKLMEAEAARETAEKALATAQQALAKAQRRVTQLEIELEGLEADHMRAQVEHQNLKANASADDHEAAIANLQKQLKLARQEAMQLRYRSNNLESVHERLEEALKDKRALEIKLTTVEGQLFEQRKHNAIAASATSSKDSAVVEQLQQQLDDKSEALRDMQREVATLQNQLAAISEHEDPAMLDALEDKVTSLSSEINELCKRNEEQAVRIEALSVRVDKVTKEKRELESIVKELVAEVESLDSIPSSGLAANDSKNKENMAPQDADPDPDQAIKANAPTKKMSSASARSVLSRYQRALRTQSETPGAATTATATTPRNEPVAAPSGSKIAHLIRNFSNATTSPSPASSSSTPSAERRASATNESTESSSMQREDLQRRRQESAPVQAKYEL